ncbi:MAG: DMT family transporter [Pseudomonadota bacterium]
MNRDLMLGAALMVGAIFLFSLMDAAAKELTSRHHPLQVVWARYTSQTAIAFVVLAPRVPKLLRTPNIGLQLVRSAFLFGATMCFFTSLSILPMATTVAIFEVAPLFITAAAFFVLREKVGLRRWLGVLIGLIGALIIIRPGTRVFSVYALLPMAAAACFAGYAISTRFLSAGESPWTSFLYTALIGTVVSCAFVPFLWSTPNLFHGALMLGMGALGGLGHYCLIRAFTTAEASFLAPFSYVALVFNTTWGVLFFTEVPDAATVAGAVTIVAAGVYVWYRETFARSPARTAT